MEYIDLKSQYRTLKPKIDANIKSVLEKSDYISGSLVQEFEKKFAEYLGVKHVIACSDGTAALQLIYMANHIGVGDAVFCPDMTFIASIEPAVLLGATPIFCEIDEQTYNIDIESLKRQIEAVIKEGKLHPRAVVAVDFLGNPADFVELREMADQYGLLLIEDAAQASSASYRGIKCGANSDIAATSFFPSKPLGCYGDGGAVMTNDDETAQIIKSMHVHGSGKNKYDNVRIGMNARLDTIQAAVLLPKLEELPTEIERRQAIAKRYNEALADYVKVPYVSQGNISSYAQYVVCAKNEKERDSIRTELSNHAIPTILYYPTPLHRLPVFKSVCQYEETFLNTDRYSQCSFGIPFSPYITDEDQKKVIDAIIAAVK